MTRHRKLEEARRLQEVQQHTDQRFGEVEDDVRSQMSQTGDRVNEGSSEDDEELEEDAPVGGDRGSRHENLESHLASEGHISAERASQIAMVGMELAHHDHVESESSTKSSSGTSISGTDAQDTSDSEIEENEDSDDDGENELMEKLLQAAKVSAYEATQGKSVDQRHGEVEVVLQFDAPDEEDTNEA